MNTALEILHEIASFNEKDRGLYNEQTVLTAMEEYLNQHLKSILTQVKSVHGDYINSLEKIKKDSIEIFGEILDDNLNVIGEVDHVKPAVNMEAWIAEDEIDLTDAICIVGSHTGKYIPQHFAWLFKDQLPDFIFSDLQNPENELYWDAWEKALNDIHVMYEGNSYSLYHDEDLWLVPNK